MTKEDIDELYHLMRVASNGTQEEVEVFNGLARHLFAGGHYLSLVQFSAFYGRKFLIEPTCKALREVGWPFNRIIEFGAGLGWLGRGISAGFDLVPTIFVDKRPWTLTDKVLNLESKDGRYAMVKEMQENDLIVMSDFLHCVVDPKAVMAPFSRWRIAVLEYYPRNDIYRKSYYTQIERYGASHIGPEKLLDVFPGRSAKAVDLDPYVLLLVDREAQ